MKPLSFGSRNRRPVTFEGATDWICHAESIRIPLRRIHGGSCLIRTARVGRGAWLVGVSTRVPGFGSYNATLSPETALATRWNAIMAGLLIARRHWQRMGVVSMVADLEAAADLDWE